MILIFSWEIDEGYTAASMHVRKYNTEESTKLIVAEKMNFVGSQNAIVMTWNAVYKVTQSIYNLVT